MPLTSHEIDCLVGLQSVTIRIAAGQELVHEGQSGHKAYILQKGWACSYKLLADGGRQIINFPLPGDFLGLRSVLLRTSDHSFSGLTDIVVSSVEGSRMMQVFNDQPRLAAAILWAASRDEAMLVEHLVNIGRRSAIERIAHFFLELFERLRLVGLATEKGFVCPLNQYVLADALGLSAIHVNRVLRQLRERRLLTLKGRKVSIGDLNALKSLAGFQDQQGPPVRSIWQIDFARKLLQISMLAAVERQSANSPLTGGAPVTACRYSWSTSFSKD